MTGVDSFKGRQHPVVLIILTARTFNRQQKRWAKINWAKLLPNAEEG